MRKLSFYTFLTALLFIISTTGCVNSVGQKDVYVQFIDITETNLVNGTQKIKAVTSIIANREGLYYTLTYDGFENMPSYGGPLNKGKNFPVVIFIPNNPDAEEWPVRFCFSENVHITWPHDTPEFKAELSRPDLYCTQQTLSYK